MAKKATKRVKRARPARGEAAGPAAGREDELRIAVTFRRPADNLGLTRYGAAMNAEAVHSFTPDPRAVEQAAAALQRGGFRVTSRGRLSLSVRGRRADFERLFGTKLTRIDLKDLDFGRRQASMVHFPAADAPWSPDPSIAALIDDAYIQWPHIYMSPSRRFDPPPPSPLPPRVEYHHLRVPGDVALLLNAARVHRAGGTGHGVRVAMIDSGFYHGHPYFQELGYNSSIVLAPGATHVDQDGNGHGTGESANVFAVAPDVTFIGVKLDNEQNPWAGASVLEGLQEALRHNPQVISVSLGYDLAFANRVHYPTLPNSLKALEAEIQAAVASGVVVVFSAGNGHVAFPGMMPEVVSAGGAYVAGDGVLRASDYASAFRSRIYAGRLVPDFCGLVGLMSNHADYIMLPLQSGCAIDQGNAAHDATATDDAWGVFSGTSASAPQLAGVCALLLEKNPGLTPAEVKAVIRRTCRDVTTGAANPASNENVPLPAGPGVDGATGAGLVDAYAAWQQA